MLDCDTGGSAGFVTPSSEPEFLHWYTLIGFGCEDKDNCNYWHSNSNKYMKEYGGVRERGKSSEVREGK